MIYVIAAHRCDASFRLHVHDRAPFRLQSRCWRHLYTNNVHLDGVYGCRGRQRTGIGSPERIPGRDGVSSFHQNVTKIIESENIKRQ